MSSDFRSDATGSNLFFTPIRTVIQAEIITTARKSLISHAPRVIRTPALLIRSQPLRRADTSIRGLTRADALADVHTRALATLHSAQAHPDKA